MRATRTRQGQRGYTAIEVLLAMTVMAIGAAGVMSMQKASIQGNLDARKMDVANAIGRTWIERLQRESMKWTLPSTASPGAASNLATAAPLIGSNVDKGWFVPNAGAATTVLSTASYAFDILGRDLASASDADSGTFCVTMQIVTLLPNTLFRADVRVLWRGAAPLGNTAPTGPFCDPSNADLTSADPNAKYATPAYHGVYVTTALRENAAQ